MRARVEAVLAWATVRGYRTGDNPGNGKAIWPKHCQRQGCPSRASRSAAYQDVPSFMTELHHREGTAARALEFLVLTAGRAGEVPWRRIGRNRS